MEAVDSGDETIAADTTADLATIFEAIERIDSMWRVPGGKVGEFLNAPWMAINQSQSLMRKLADRYSKHEAFVFASFGSSVTAGHDHFINQSWPFQLEQLLASVFKATGFDFKLQQRAVGGYGEMPYTAGCMAGRVEEGIDAVDWEWGMFYDSKCETHHFLQEVDRMPGRPVIFGFEDTSLSFADTEEGQKLRQRLLQHNDDAEFGSERKWRPNDWYLTESFVSREELSAWAAEAPGRGAEHVAALERMLDDPSRKQYLERIGVLQHFRAEGQGWHPLSITAASAHVVGEPWFRAREKAFNINWHSGPLGHSLIASVLGRRILQELATALENQAWTLRRTDSSVEKPEHIGPNPLVGSEDVSPQDISCGQLVANRCFTGMEPHNRGSDIAVLVEGVTKWDRTLSRESGGDVVDRRVVLQGTKNEGELVLKIDVPAHDHYLLMCQAPCGWSCSTTSGFMSSTCTNWGRNSTLSDGVFTVNGEAVPDPMLEKLQQELFAEGSGMYCPGCKAIANVCQVTAKLAPGVHTVGLMLRDGLADGTVMELIQVMLVGAMMGTPDAS